MCGLQLQSLATALWRRHFMLLEGLDAQGTFFKQSKFYSIGFPYEADEERGEKEKGKGMGHREDERKYRSGETLLNVLLQEWNLHLRWRFFAI